MRILGGRLGSGENGEGDANLRSYELRLARPANEALKLK